jgi:hypothetical protein
VWLYLPLIKRAEIEAGDRDRGNAFIQLTLFLSLLLSLFSLALFPLNELDAVPKWVAEFETVIAGDRDGFFDGHGRTAEPLPPPR